MTKKFIALVKKKKAQKIAYIKYLVNRLIIKIVT